MSSKTQANDKNLDETKDMDEETLNLFQEVKPQRLSLHLLVKRNLPRNADSWDQEKIFSEINNLTHVRLDRENISDIDSLDLLGSNVTNLYLQQNQITRIENLDCLTNLRFITLSGNRLKKVKNIRQLEKLLVLDVSDNNITQLNTGELPESLIMLNMSGNKCATLSDYRTRVLQALPNLRQLDNIEISRKERLEAGCNVSSDEECPEESDAPRSRSRMLREHEVDEPITSLTSAVLLRSQDRLEEGLTDHRRHTIELNNICKKTRLPRIPSSKGQSDQ